jgi:membrane-associated phospholipid phosphatase
MRFLSYRGRRAAVVLAMAALAACDNELPTVTGDSSFPSGHSGNSMAVFAAIALIAVPRAWRRSALALAIAASIAIGLTRPYLGVHWPSDVVGGWALGLLAAGLAVAIGRRLGVSGLESQHQIVGGHELPLDEDQAA